MKRFQQSVLPVAFIAALAAYLAGPAAWAQDEAFVEADPAATADAPAEAEAEPFVAVEAPSVGVVDPLSWRVTPPTAPDAVVVRGATIWTSGPQGRLEAADLLIADGKVVAVGPDLDAPRGAVEIDGTGKHVTAGLIDAHSHSALDSVNEGTHIVTAEVRMRDVINPDDRSIYQQLAGGVTTIHQLHGSANSIGGQSSVLKLRWGQDAAGLLFQDAPPTIKFALGENPKQSNWNVDVRRFPQTRSGVEQSIHDAFQAAVDYRARQKETKSGQVPERRDEQMETLLEILDGDRLVHAHSYRADEILMLMRVAESFGFQISTFQHVLEGYKVADELAAHGAGASTFSDWWAYKFEVVDAIPYNGALMYDRDVVVSFNSDSGELARRLNLEAAKAVRYGGVPQEDALRFVTLNPAIQIGLDDRIGSLEPGKDGDFVIWSGSPLSTYSIVEQTWVDGARYFDRAADLEARQALAAERQALLDAVRAAGGEDDEGDDEEAAAEPDETEPKTAAPEHRDGHAHPHPMEAHS